MYKKLSIKFIFIILAFSINSYISAQNNNNSIPIFENFSDYDNPTKDKVLWDISQNSEGILYFGTNEYLATFDGARWNKIKISEISCMVFSSKENRMYIGTQSDFGYIQMENNGKYEYINLSNKLKNLKIKTTWRILNTNSGIYFFANKNTIINYNNDILTTLDNPKNFSPNRGFYALNSVYAVDDNAGICYINNNKLVLLANTQSIAKQSIRDMIAISKNEILIATKKNGLYLFDKSNQKIEKIATQADDYLIKNELYRGVKIKNGFAFATLFGGLVVLDNNMKINYILTRELGLPTNTIYSLFIDRDKKLWLCTNNGAVEIYVNNNIYLFSNINGILGNIFNFKILKDKIIVGTNEGIFSKQNDETKFSSIYDNGYVHYFEEIINPKTNKKYELSSSLRNIICIDNQNVVHDIDSFYSIVTSVKLAENTFFMSHYSGGSIFEFEFINNVYKIKNCYNIKNYDYFTISTCLDNQNNLWFASLSNGIAFLELDDINNIDTNNLIVNKIDTTASGLPSNNKNYIYFENNKLYIASSKGLYEIENNEIQNYKFKPSTDFGLDYSKDSIIVYYMKSDKNNNTWLATSEGLKKYDSQIQKLISSPFKKAVGDFEESKIHFEEPNIVWFSTKEAIYVLKDKIYFKETKVFYDILIRKITLKDNNILYINKNKNTNYSFENDSIIKLKNKIAYKNNFIKLEYTLPFYEKSKNTTYSTKLIGIDKEWSAWTKNNESIYQILPSGKYEFKVKAKNSYGEESNVFTIIFIIKTPWYRTNLAIIIYISLFFVIVFILFKRYKNRTKKLEKIVKQRTEEIEKQNKKIKKQKKKLELNKIELEVRTKNLELSNKEQKHFSIVAKLTKESVIILDRKGNFEWWNRGFTELFYYKYDKYKDASFREKQQKLRPDITKIIKNYSKDKGRISYTSHEFFENGEEIWYQTTITPVLDDNGFIYRFVVLDINQTDIKSAEKKNREQKASLSNYEKQLQNLIKENDWQNKIIEEGYKAMSNSIEYANKIQLSFLPTQTQINKIFPNNFILNNPKDIISGDFYWIEKDKDITILAVADSTGHGIPGGFMTTLGIASLKEIINTTDKLEANILLNNFRTETIKKFNKIAFLGKNIENIDISLCLIDHKKNELQYAGANQPIFTTSKKEIKQWKSDRMPINGNYKRDIPFTNNKMKIKSGDKLYMFTDGYYDQFGGLRNNKFYLSKFRKLIFSIHEKEMKEQENILINEFYKWKGENFRVDDILIIGVVIP